MPTSVIIVAIVGLVLGGITNITLGLICGGVFGLIAWSLTGFRTGNTPSSSLVELRSSSAVVLTDRSETPDFPSLSPQDIGRGLAVSLGTSCKLEDISEIESFSETNGADGRAEGFGDFIDTPMCQAVNAPDRR